MKQFYLKSITIDKQCSPALMKALRPGKYKLAEQLPDGLYIYGKKVSVCAIVGENGAGKSSLLDILYRIINNFSYYTVGKVLTRRASDNLFYVQGLYASIEYTTNRKDCQIICRGNSVGIVRNDEKWYFTDSIKMKDDYFERRKFEHKNELGRTARIDLLMDCFYTVATNYSIQAFNSLDYQSDGSYMFAGGPNHAGSASDGIWLDSIFNKNDGYLVPLSLNPYRNRGKIDMEAETERTTDRLVALLVQYERQSKEFLAGYQIDFISYEFDEYAIINKLLRHRPKNDNGRDIRYTDELYRRIKECMTEDKSYLSIILKEYDVEYTFDGSIRDNACIYLGYKTLLIARNYPSYHGFARLGNPWNIFELMNEEDVKRNRSLLIGLVRKIMRDPSHISTKIHQTINFLKSPNVDKTDFYLRKFSLPDYELKTHKMITSTSVERYIRKLPPPIFKVNVMLHTTKTKQGANSSIPLSHLSSGERQLLFMMSTLVYHIMNIKSVLRAREHYRNINIILDEVEICFHPEYQRLLVNYIVSLIRDLDLNNHCSFNIILTTHSPFILSDIVPDNILYLKKGKPYPMRKEEMQPFAANINDILRDGFFLEKGFLGEHAKQQILSLIQYLKSKRQDNGIWNDETAAQFIAMIGEPLLHDTLEELRKEHEAYRNK